MKLLTLAAAALLLSGPAHAATAAAPPPVDITSLLATVIGGAFTVVSAVAVALINSHVKDRTAADNIDKAVVDALGVMQQAISGTLAARPITVPMPPGTIPAMQAAVQYVVDQAGDDLKRINITPAMIAQRIEARLGVVSIQSNIATAASSLPQSIMAVNSNTKL